MPRRNRWLTVAVLALGPLPGGACGDAPPTPAPPAATSRANQPVAAAPPPARAAKGAAATPVPEAPVARDPLPPWTGPGPRPPLQAPHPKALLYERHSEFSHARVRQTGSIRSLYFVQPEGTEWPQSAMDVRDPAVPALAYAKTAFASLAYTPRAPRRVLLLGLGGGAMIGFLRKHVPEGKIVAVDIDPVVVEIAQAWFGVVPDDHLELVTADAVAYVRDTRETFDTIYLDTFLEPSGSDTDSSGVPKSLRTVEFLRAVRGRLTPHGVAAFNLHHKSDLQGHLDAIQAAFADTHLIRVPGSSNRIVVGSAQGKLPTPTQIEERATKLDARLGAGFALAPLVRDILVLGPAAPAPTGPQGR